MSTDYFKSLLSEFGKKIGMDLTPDEDNYTCMPINNEQSVLHIKYDSITDELTILSEIGKASDDSQKMNIYPIILKANSEYEDTKGATISKATGEDTITIAKRQFVPQFENQDVFDKFFENFIEIAEKWIENLLQLSRGENINKFSVNSDEFNENEEIPASNEMAPNSPFMRV